MTKTHVIAYSVYATLQCECGDAFIVTKVDDPVVCPGCLQVYRLAQLQVEMVDDANFEPVLLDEFSE